MDQTRQSSRQSSSRAVPAFVSTGLAEFASANIGFIQSLQPDSPIKVSNDARLHGIAGATAYMARNRHSAPSLKQMDRYLDPRQSDTATADEKQKATGIYAACLVQGGAVLVIDGEKVNLLAPKAWTPQVVDAFFHDLRVTVRELAQRASS